MIINVTSFTHSFHVITSGSYSLSIHLASTFPFLCASSQSSCQILLDNKDRGQLGWVLTFEHPSLVSILWYQLLNVPASSWYWILSTIFHMSLVLIFGYFLKLSCQPGPGIGYFLKLSYQPGPGIGYFLKLSYQPGPSIGSKADIGLV
jgi:amino acid transporter